MVKEPDLIKGRLKLWLLKGGINWKQPFLCPEQALVLMFTDQLYTLYLLPDTGVELLLKKLLGNNSKLKLCLMDFLFLLEKP